MQGRSVLSAGCGGNRNPRIRRNSPPNLACDTGILYLSELNMPVIRCPKCDQPYDIPPPVAIKLPSSIAKCHCGEWLCGNREALINRVLGDGELEEIDVSLYLLEATEIDIGVTMADQLERPDVEEGPPRSVRITASAAGKSIDTVFTVDRFPLLIGRRGCHVEIDDADLSIRHCEIGRVGRELVLRDSDSHTGTFLDGQQIDEAIIGDGTHLIRIGKALVCVEPTSEEGTPVGQIELSEGDLMQASPLLMKKLLEKGAKEIAPAGHTRLFLVCTEGPCAGQEFEVPSDGGVVGREGSVKIPDEYLSRKHFSLFRDAIDGTLRIQDLGSSNGTFLNTLPATATKVHNGDQIRAGFTEFRIEERQLSGS